MLLIVKNQNILYINELLKPGKAENFPLLEYMFFVVVLMVIEIANTVMVKSY